MDLSSLPTNLSKPSLLIYKHHSKNHEPKTPITPRTKRKQDEAGGGACTRFKTLHTFQLIRNDSRLGVGAADSKI